MIYRVKWEKKFKNQACKIFHKPEFDVSESVNVMYKDSDYIRIFIIIFKIKIEFP